jgi:anaerobic magnesium-protoporphyrin IX monomethyl ester cyclase
MKIKRVFLIKVAYDDSYYNYNDLPAGLGYVSQALDDSNIENTVFDMHIGPKIEELYKAIKDFSPELIGLSLMSYRFLKHYELIHSIKDKFVDIPIVVGGPHVSTFRDDILKRCQAIDFGVTLEGDQTIVDLCNNIDNPSMVTGLIYRDDEEILYTGDREYIKDLDSMDFPKYARFNLEKYEFITIITSRGCPFKCIYCPVIYTIGDKWRCRSAMSVVNELEYWYKNGFNRFEFGDDNFTLKRKRVLEICDEIEKRKMDGLEIGLGNGIRADRVDKPLLKRMKEVGFSYVAFGVEAGNNKVLKALNKGETIEKIEEGIKAACEVGFPVHLFFLLGSPSETEEDVEDSLRLALKYPVVDVRFYNILPFPRSVLYNKLKENDGGKFVSDAEVHLNNSSHWVFMPIFETPELSVDDRVRLLKRVNMITKRHTDKVNSIRRIDHLRQRGVPKVVALLMINAERVGFLKQLMKKSLETLGVFNKLKQRFEWKSSL